MNSYFNSVFKIFQLSIVLSLGSTLLCGCQSKQSNPNLSNTKGIESPRVDLAPGDVIDVKFFYTPELNESQTVRPDGKIALQLIGEVKVEGKSPAELRDELLKLYEPQLKGPEISIVVRSLRNQRVYIGGQVMKPGIVEMPGQMSLLEAIMQAGGFDIRQAELRNIVVIRHKNDKRFAYSVDLKPALEGDETEQFILEPKDIVYVPQTEIAKMGQWVDQHINKLVPQTGFIFSRSYGRTTVGIDTSAR
jgi:polysaccharide export outer membrane protein